MKIKILNFGMKNKPSRAHYNDAGADVYANYDWVLLPGETMAFGLGFGLEIPDGMMGLIFPRSGLAKKGICCQLPPIDSGYRGEIHAIVTNYGHEPYPIRAKDRIGQLVILPIVIPELSEELGENRDAGAFGSTGK